MGLPPWRWLRDPEGIPHLVAVVSGGGLARAICGAAVVDPAAPGADDGAPAAGASLHCLPCGEVHQDLDAGRRLRVWRERGSVFTDQQAADVVTVHVGGLEIHVWRHPDGALIEGLERDPRRHAAFVSICRDPEEAGARAVFLATSHGARCLERPAWPVMHLAVEVPSGVPE